MNAMSSIAQDQHGCDRFDAVLITNRNMEPTFPLNSVAFLGEPSYSTAFLYYAVFNQWGFAGIYRVQSRTDGVSFSLDDWPSHSQPSFVLTIEEVRSMDLRLVEGIARPFTGKFGNFLRDRFMTQGDWS